MDEYIRHEELTNILKFPSSSLPLHLPQEKQNFTGPISGPMSAKVKKLKSRMPDTFDYSIYDKIYHRFGDKQPRGGVVFKAFMKLLEAEDCKSCFYRFEIDTYGRGCVFNCAYCYAKSYLSVHKMWNEPMPFPLDIGELRKTFATIFETDKQHRFRKIMEKRIPLRIGSMSDSFMWIDKKYKVTQELLKILKFYEYPYIIFTRSDLVAADEYMDLLDPKLTSIQMSISSINESMTRLIEPGAPSPQRRLAALQRLGEAGFWTTARINPLFPIYPDGYFTNPRYDRTKAIKPFDYFSWDIVDALADHNVPTVLAGVVRLYSPNIRFMSKALGWDLRDTFAPSKQFSREFIEFSLPEANYYYQKLQHLCAQRGIRFTTCYIGGDSVGESFYYNQHLWSNKKDCCDALGNVPAFKKTCADINKQLLRPVSNSVQNNELPV